jgi:acetoin:2,6-dichlorophenolindophenol oxidoreductase subunit alpha
MAESADGSSAYENPLIRNARLRQIYLAMVKARMLEKALPAARRGRVVGDRHAVGMVGLEACLVSPAVDLGSGDLVSDALAGGVMEFLRGAGLKEVFRPAARGGKVSGKRVVGGALADSGTAARLPETPGIAERFWVAMGAATALKAAARAKLETKAEGGTARLGVVVVYVRAGEASAAVWCGALRFAAEQELPIVFVVLPSVRGSGSAKTGGVNAMSRSCGVPGIAVDADDAVAIYRVAQESIGRARAGGGAAVMECVAFVQHGASAVGSGDAIAAMERYMLQRGVVTRRWMEAEARSFARRLAAAKA